MYAVSQKISELEGKRPLDQSLPWTGSRLAALRDGFTTKVNRYDVDNATLPQPDNSSTAKAFTSSHLDSQATKRVKDIATIATTEIEARREPATPRAHLDISSDPIEYRIVSEPPSEMATGILDSGASVSVTNPHTVTYYGLEMIPWDTGPIRIQFGSGNVEESTHYVNFNQVFTKVAVIKDAPDTLISIYNLVEAGFDIKLSRNGSGVYLNDQLVFPGARCPRNRLFYMNIDEIISSNVLVPQMSQLANQQRQAAEGPTTSVTPPTGASKPKQTAKPHQAKALGNKTSTVDPISDKLIREVFWLHKRMGHPSAYAMTSCIRNLTWQDVDEQLTPRLVRKVMSKLTCTACALAKRNKLPQAGGTGIKPSEPGTVLSVDYQGKISPISTRGFTRWFIIKDLKSSYRHSIMTKSKSAAALIEALSHAIDFYNLHGHRVDKVRFDAGSTENSADVEAFLLEHNIITDSSAADEQQQNPVEREVQTLTKGVSALLLDQTSLGPSWWCYAVESWTATANATSTTSETSPFEQVTGKPPSIASKFLFPFGCPVTCTKIEGREPHYATINEFGIALGSSAGSNKATLVLIPSKGLKPYERLHVRPLSIAPPTGSSTATLDLEQLVPTFLENGIQFKSAAAPRDLTEEPHPGTIGMSMFDIPPDSSVSSRTRSIKPHIPPTSLPRDNPTTGDISHLIPKVFATKRIARTDANPTLTSARRDEATAAKWQPAIDSELKLLRDLDVADVMKQSDITPEIRRQIIMTKMDLKTKFFANGDVNKLKARLVVLGMLEKRGADEQNYSPTADPKIVNLIFALAAQHDLYIKGIDIFGAFITASTEGTSDVYVQLPNGLADDADGLAPVWKLKRALYGLRRSPRLFYTQLRAFLLRQGYTASSLDDCLFYKTTPDDKKIFFCTHVDDFAIASTHPDLIEELCTALKTEYIITESDSLEDFLGVHMERHDGRLYLCQPGLIKRLISRADLPEGDHHILHNPMREDFNDDYQNDAEACDPELYRSILGMLIYVLRSRPDIAYAVNRLATRSICATTRDLDALKRVVAYLRCTAHFELVYSTNDCERSNAIARLHGYCDAAYLCHTDSKSHSGLAFHYGPLPTGAFFSQSKKQTTVATSSCHAEVNAAFSATQHIKYFRELLAELGYPQVTPTELWVDNLSLITLATKFSGSTKNVKHFMMRVNYMIEQVADGVIKLAYINTNENHSDTLTKPLGPGPFAKHTLTVLGPQRVKDAVVAPKVV